MTIIMLDAVKMLCPSCGSGVANMWCTHTPNPMNAVAIIVQHKCCVAKRFPPRKCRDDHRHESCRREENDVNLWMAKEPKQVLPQDRIAALGLIEKVRADTLYRRSIESRVDDSITAGIAKMTMNAVTSIDHTYSGIRFSDIPGARCLNMVTMISTAATRAEISVRLTICDQTSTRFPMPYSGPDSGTYANHPASGPIFRISADK